MLNLLKAGDYVTPTLYYNSSIFIPPIGNIPRVVRLLYKRVTLHKFPTKRVNIAPRISHQTRHITPPTPYVTSNGDGNRVVLTRTQCFYLLNQFQLICASLFCATTINLVFI